MVKVWEQQYPGGDVTYIDESGVTHVEGAQHRQTMPDAYPLPSTAPAGVTRKTPRGRKVPQQGRGSIKQGPWRECFKKCTIRWDALPDECPWNAECPPTSSKKNVWDAKQAQGVMCAYYDLYQACCMSHCQQITITGPKGKPVTIGIISPYEDCFPCPNPSTGKILSIAYWSLQMSAGGYQMLSAHDSVTGYSIPFCEDDQLQWSIVSGGGSLSNATGLSTEYHAPDENENCVQNPVIRLTDCCGRSATLTLAVNKVTGWVAYRVDEPTSFYHANCHRDIDCAGSVWWSNHNQYYCDGTLASSDLRFCLADCDGTYDPKDPCTTTAGNCELIPVDLRTPEQILAGCCPAALL